MEATGDGAVQLGDGNRMLWLMLLKLCQCLFEHRQGLVVHAHVLLADAEVPVVLPARRPAFQVNSLQEPRLCPLILLELVVDGAQVDERGRVWRSLVGQLLQQLRGVGLSVLLAAKRRHVLQALHVPGQTPAATLADAAAVDGVGLVQLVALDASQSEVEGGSEQLRTSEPLWRICQHLLELLPEATENALVLLLPVVELVLRPQKVLLPELCIISHLVAAGPWSGGDQVPSADCLCKGVIHRRTPP
mmetsp:Transcript_5913/g.17662  ORF Transcript_5913/g.17662 Transcript_5913/m.17662 type:complete len:247 (-) Transcript_5913:805-1545(-)